MCRILEDAPFARSEDLTQSFANLKQQHEAAVGLLRQRSDQAKTDAERKTLSKVIWTQTMASANKAFAWAEANPNDPNAIDAIIWTVHGLANGNYPECAAEHARAFRLLTRRALDNEKVAPLCYYANGASESCLDEIQLLNASLTKSKSRLIRGAACLGLARADHSLASLVLRSRDPITRKTLELGWKGIDFLDQLPGRDPKALDRQAEAYYHRLIDEFADLKMPTPPLQPNPLRRACRRRVVRTASPSNRPAAARLEGEAVRGQKLHLVDYRGKVVAVVFWATWCAPCMAMVPHERDLVKRLKEKPFVLHGVNGDDDRAKAAETMTRESMSWPSLFNGGSHGGIVAKSGVSTWPTIDVIDAQGTIRYKTVRGQSLDEAIEKLLAEAETARK